MIRSVNISNFTVFSSIECSFAPNLNVFIGENGSGKTHILKLLYSALACSAEQGRKKDIGTPTKSAYQPLLAEKLNGVFRPNTLGRLVRRKQGRERCDVEIRFQNDALDIKFDFATNAKREVVISLLPQDWQGVFPAFIPTRELLTIFPNFVSIYDNHFFEFEETWRDLCVLLGAPLQRGPKEKKVAALLSPLQEAMGGSISLAGDGCFTLVNPGSGNMEIPLVADGVRKLGMLARLISTGTLLEQGYLFWDEPEANLNPRLVKLVAESIWNLSNSGIQVFLATHSLFLMRELEILMTTHRDTATGVSFFGLHNTPEGTEVQPGTSLDEIGEIVTLDEELQQTDRFYAQNGV